jgi:hypothetical protein
MRVAGRREIVVLEAPARPDAPPEPPLPDVSATP